MTERTNVTDDEFGNDGIASEDYKRDVNAADEDVRALAREMWGAGGVIIEGGELGTGTEPDTLKIIPCLRARDKDLRAIVIAGVEDNIPAVDTAGGWNYVAAKHKWSYDVPRGAYDSSQDFYTVRYDDYEVDVALSRQDEDNAYIVLGRARYEGDSWVFDYSVRTRDLVQYSAGMVIAISEKYLTAAAWYPPACDDLADIFSWENRVVMLQFADGQDAYGDGLPVDLHTTVKVTTSWAVCGQLKDDMGSAQDISIRANDTTPKRLEFKAAAGTVSLRGLITLLGGAYNSDEEGGQ